MLQEGRCRVENVDDMQVLDHNRRPMFSARHPLVHLDDAIKRIATKQLITNKVCDLIWINKFDPDSSADQRKSSNARR
jgi:hypothetical protein